MAIQVIEWLVSSSRRRRRRAAPLSWPVLVTQRFGSTGRSPGDTGRGPQEGDLRGGRRQAPLRGAGAGLTACGGVSFPFHESVLDIRFIYVYDVRTCQSLESHASGERAVVRSVGRDTRGVHDAWGLVTPPLAVGEACGPRGAHEDAGQLGGSSGRSVRREQLRHPLSLRSCTRLHGWGPCTRPRRGGRMFSIPLRSIEASLRDRFARPARARAEGVGCFPSRSGRPKRHFGIASPGQHAPAPRGVGCFPSRSGRSKRHFGIASPGQHASAPRGSDVFHPAAEPGAPLRGLPGRAARVCAERVGCFPCCRSTRCSASRVLGSDCTYVRRGGRMFSIPPQHQVLRFEGSRVGLHVCARSVEPAVNEGPRQMAWESHRADVRGTGCRV
jgi:hypothetical protein